MDRINQQTSSFDSELKLTADAIVGECPRFRILVMGKAGKSSLINQAFNVDLANVSHRTAGTSDINVEIMSDSNPRFVLHDSQGFEVGEVNNFNTVKTFIEKRGRQSVLKEKLHAVWLCVEIPIAGGRVFESGVEEFLKLDLGRVPIIVVFTKYDLLVSAVENKAFENAHLSALDEKEFDNYVKQQAEKEFDEICGIPFRHICGDRVHPHIKISTKREYEEALANLIKLTHEHVSEAVWLIWAVAQRASADVKIAASIAVGKKKYWRGLASSVHFPGKTLKQCLDVIHDDIVSVWNFNDPQMHLMSAEFKALMSRLVDDLAGSTTSNPNKALAAGVSTVAAIAGIVSALSGPAAPIVIPIAGAFVLAAWVTQVYSETAGILRCLVGYIVDLTVVMQSLFWLMRACTGARPLTRRLVKLAFNEYLGSKHKQQVHHEIGTYVAKARFVNRTGPDHVLNKIVSLIGAHRFDPTKGLKMGTNADEVVAGSYEEDEAWDVIDESPSGEL